MILKIKIISNSLYTERLLNVLCTFNLDPMSRGHTGLFEIVGGFFSLYSIRYYSKTLWVSKTYLVFLSQKRLTKISFFTRVSVYLRALQIIFFTVHLSHCSKRQWKKNTKKIMNGDGLRTNQWFFFFLLFLFY